MDFQDQAGAVASPLTKNGIALRIIDTHVHVWKYASPWMDWIADRPDNWNVVRKDFPWEVLRAELSQCDVDELILVQASPSCEESRAYLALAAAEPSILGVVGWVSLASAAATERDLLSLDGVGRHKLVGIRNNHGWLPDGEILATPQAYPSCKMLASAGLSLDLHFRDQRELPLALSIAEAVPELTLIIDHLGKPLVRDRAAFAQWQDSISRLADYPNIFLKYSGWATFLGGARSDDIRRHVEHAFSAFGAERIMFGSNWPVALVADDYETTFRATMEALPVLDEDALRAFLSETALRCYRLPRDA
jgi:L-fuconolactonase